MPRIRVAAFTAGRWVPSSRFRVRQYSDVLASNGVDLIEYCPRFHLLIRLPGPLGQIRRRYLFPWLVTQMFINVLSRIPAFVGARSAELSLINRQVIPGLNETVHLLPRPRILDADDAIWLTDPRGVRAAARLARNVDAVIAGNEYLADWYRQHNERVYILPTAIDTELYRPIADKAKSERSCCTIGWIGTSSNFPNLELARPATEAVVQGRDDVRVLIISDRRPNNWRFDGRKFIFRKWSAASEISDLQDMDIGMMPLQDTDWTRGKCSFKMLQYLAVGIPVVVSPVGMNREVLDAANIGCEPRTNAEWISAMTSLCEDPSLRHKLGVNGRKVVENKYSTKVVGEKLSKILWSEAPK